MSSEEATNDFPPFFDEILEATDGGRTIFESLLPDLDLSERQQSRGMYNPTYNDTKPSLYVFWSKAQDRYVYFDHGTKEKGDAIELYRQIYQPADHFNLRELLSAQFMDGARSSQANEEDRKKQMEKREQEKREMQRKELQRLLLPQPLCYPSELLIKRDKPTILHELSYDLFGQAGLDACRLYRVSQGKCENEVYFPIISPQGDIHAFKRTAYRWSEGRITKKNINGQPLGIGYQWPEGLEGSERRRLLYGAHLLHENTKPTTIGIVEAEENAILATACGRFPNMVFMAMGGSWPKLHWLLPFKKHRIVIMPDNDIDIKQMAKNKQEIEVWRQEHDLQVVVRNPLLRLPQDRLDQLLGKKRAEKADIGDYIVAVERERQRELAKESRECELVEKTYTSD